MGTFRTKLDFSSNRQVKQYEKTITVLSGGTSFGVTFSGLTSGPDLSTTGISESITSIASTFSGNSGTTNYNWFDSRMILGQTALSAITPSTSASTQETGTILTVNSSTTIDGNFVALSYSGVSFDLSVIAMYDLGGGSYSGTVITNTLDILSASTLDYTGRTIWNDVHGITRTEKLIITKNPQIGYVWTCMDSEGMGGWTPVSGTSGTSLWTAGTGYISVVMANSDGDASGPIALVEGYGGIASGSISHAEGYTTIAGGDYSHAEGIDTKAFGYASHAEGDNTTANGSRSHAEGIGSQALVNYSHAEGNYTTASGNNSHSEGYQTVASGTSSHAEGDRTISGNEATHAEGSRTTALGNQSHSEGLFTTASGNQAHAEGNYTIASGTTSHSEGSLTIAGGNFSHSEGLETTASGAASHAEGAYTLAKGTTAHAEGQSTTASADWSHAEGQSTTASATWSHAGGFNSVASGLYSFVHGEQSSATNNNTIVFGNQITGTSANTVYVPDLVIDGLTSTDPIATDSNGKIVAGTSDARLKQNINLLTNSLDIVKNLRGVSFEYTTESNMGDGIRYGFIAQEVQKFVPDIVRNRSKGDGMLSLNYTEIVPILVEAVKELSNGITTINNTHLETQTILAEDNNVELNFNGTQESSIGGGLSVLHAKGQDQSANLITDENGDFITNNDFKPNALTIPLFTPSSTNDIAGTEGNITRDDNYMYIKTSTGWKRTNLENF